MSGPSWTKGKRQARFFLAALIDFANGIDSENPPALYRRLARTVTIEWVNTGSSIESLTLSVRNALLTDLALLSSSEAEEICSNNARNVIKCLECLGLLTDNRYNQNAKKWSFTIQLPAQDKNIVTAWLLDDNVTPNEWDARRKALSTNRPGANSPEPVLSNQCITSFGLSERVREKSGADPLPRNQNSIWGRQAYITQVVEYFSDPQNKPSVSISGTAGYGKTQAAICIGWEALRRGLFQSIYYIKARDRSLMDGKYFSDEQQSELNWSEFRSALVQQMEGCLSHQLERRLRREKSLIIFDNAETAKMEEIFLKLEPMLNPSHLLITSRSSYDPAKIKMFNIPGLERPAALAYLDQMARERSISSILSATESVINQAYDFSCGAPLALEFIAGRAGVEGSLKNALKDLKEADRNVEEFYKYAFEFAWQAIDDNGKEILKCVANRPASLLDHEIMRFCKMERGTFNDTVHLLQQLFLIKGSSTINGNRLDVHPWIRAAINKMGAMFEQENSLELYQRRIDAKDWTVEG